MSPLLLGAALGATSAFILDPQQGHRRRALVRDKVVRGLNDSRQFADAARVDLRARAQGVAARARRLRGGEPASENAEHVAALQGGTEAHGEKWEVFEDAWTPGVRALVGGAGVVSGIYALARGGFGALVPLALGATLLACAVKAAPRR